MPLNLYDRAIQIGAAETLSKLDSNPLWALHFNVLDRFKSAKNTRLFFAHLRSDGINEYFTQRHTSLGLGGDNEAASAVYFSFHVHTSQECG
jgi:hypothetical protein